MFALIVSQSVIGKSPLLWSQVDQANDYPGTKEDNQGNWESIGDPGSEIETSTCSEFAEEKKELKVSIYI